MLKVYNEFERNPALLAKLARWRNAIVSCVFADVMYRTGVMDRRSNRRSRPKSSAGDHRTLSKATVDPLKALEMGQPGDVIVVHAGGDMEFRVRGSMAALLRTEASAASSSTAPA